MTTWYRYEESHHGERGIVVREYEVLRETPKGVWLDVDDGERFVLLGARKRYACPTMREAQDSFIARKRRQIRILDAQRNAAVRALESLGVTLTDHPRWLG